MLMPGVPMETPEPEEVEEDVEPTCALPIASTAPAPAPAPIKATHSHFLLLRAPLRAPDVFVIEIEGSAGRGAALLCDAAYCG